MGVALAIGPYQGVKAKHAIAITNNLWGSLINTTVIKLKRSPTPGPSSQVKPTSDPYVLPAEGEISSEYGWRWGKLHRGLDIANQIGTPIVSSAAGRVTYAGWNDYGYGYLIEVLHANGVRTLYGHNSKILVKLGQSVRQSQPIALMGSTGRSDGPHLHFEIIPSGNQSVNPRALLDMDS